MPAGLFDRQRARELELGQESSGPQAKGLDSHLLDGAVL